MEKNMSKKLDADTINKEISDRGIKMIGKYKAANSPTQFQCSIGHTWECQASSVIYGKHGCPYCAGNKVLKGYNDIWTTNPKLGKLLANKEDGYRYAQNSNTKVGFKCPNCGFISKKEIYMVNSYGFVCSACSDGISYPNKFMRNVLTQLNINYVPEYQIEKSFYDNYFEYGGMKYLVEVDGRQHQDNSWLRDDIANDKKKNKLANDYGYKLIRINAYFSKKDLLEKEIKANLGPIINLSMVDWDAADIYASKSNIMKEISDCWNSGNKNIIEISKQLNIKACSIRKYLKKAANIGWCNYKARTGVKNKIKISYIDLTEEDKKEIIALFEKYHNIRKVSNELEIGYTVVIKYLRAASEQGLCSYIYHKRINIEINNDIKVA